MRIRHLKPLLAIEFQRQGPVVLRVQAAALVLAGLFVVLGKNPAENVMAVLAGTPIGVVLLAPMTVVRDKLERTLEFLCTLPATATELVAARFLAAAAILLPGVLLLVPASLVLPLSPPFDSLPELAVISAVLGYWLLLTVCSWLLTAAAAVFDFARLLRWPLGIAMLLLVVLPLLVERVAPGGTARALLGIAQQPWAPVGAAVLSLALLLGGAAAAFAMTRRAFATYRPDFEHPL